MKILDWKTDGSNFLRLYLGGNELEYWWGDDWDDAPYEDNAGQVYSDYVCSTMDVIVPDEAVIFSPDNLRGNPISKQDIVSNRLPVVIDLKGKNWNWDEAKNDPETIKFVVGKELII